MPEITDITTDKVHKPLGHYVAAKVIPPEKKLVLLSGVLPMDKDGDAVLPGHAYDSATLALKIGLTIIEEAGGTIESFAKITVYLNDPRFSELVDRAFDDFFGTHFTARVMIAVSGGIPKGLDLELDITAAV
ncbi:MAG: RidA family protein [Patescibacteria group bacterium]|nr:RidA family protein [Patescibacteria group bacterium]MDD5716011.1 RidA family protein [Patescibacteria group bacterium]